NRIRLDNINTGTGEVISVTYTGEDCAWNNLPSATDANNRRCFPQIAADATTSWWHKYVLTDVVDDDLLGPGVDEKWHYDYDFKGSTSTALWKYDQNWHTPPAQRTWSRWAGYSTVYTTHQASDGTGPKQFTETL